jgi:predicted dehydrogenase
MSTKITVWGTNGRIAVDRQECQIYLRSEVKAPINLTKGWTIRYTTDLIEPVWFYLRGEEYSSQIAHFMQCIRGAVPSNISSFASAVETDRVVSSMLERAEAAGMEQPMSAGSSAPTRKNSRIAFLRRRLRWSL